jgi:hypothetical protein
LNSIYLCKLATENGAPYNVVHQINLNWKFQFNLIMRWDCNYINKNYLFGLRIKLY